MALQSTKVKVSLLKVPGLQADLLPSRACGEGWLLVIGLVLFPHPHSLCVHAYFHLLFYHVLLSELPFRLLINCLYCLIWVKVLSFRGSGRVSYGIHGCTGTTKVWSCGLPGSVACRFPPSRSMLAADSSWCCGDETGKGCSAYW